MKDNLMKQNVAVIICNFNKKEFVLQCIDSVRALRYQNITIYVVDNASTDGSAEAIQAQFGDDVHLIVNPENLGGSGGFNTGIREALKEDYPYIYLLDNDVILDHYALSELVAYLDSHPGAAIAGSVIYSMDHPDELQEMGAKIDWDNYYITPCGKGWLDSGKPAKTMECDYVPACSMLVRTEAVRKVGIMDESNFIYWDDIEWGHRMKQAGYQVAVVPSSKVWHKMGVAQRSNTFGTYYFWRNRLNFFLRNVPDDTISRFATQIFSELFQAVYACNFNHKFHSARTILYAVEDALSGVRGKAPVGRICDADPTPHKLEELLNGKTEALVTDFEDLKTVRDVVNRIRQVRPDINLVIASGYHDLHLLTAQFPETKVVSWKEGAFNQYPLVLRICHHIMELGSAADPGIYIDRFLNIVGSQADLEYVKNFDSNFRTAEAVYYPIFLDKVLSFKQKNSVKAVTIP